MKGKVSGLSGDPLRMVDGVRGSVEDIREKGALSATFGREVERYAMWVAAAIEGWCGRLD